jgi:hypothetical protein
VQQLEVEKFTEDLQRVTFKCLKKNVSFDKHVILIENTYLTVGSM